MANEKEYEEAKQKARELPIEVGVISTVSAFLTTIQNLEGLLALLPPTHPIYDDIAYVADEMKSNLAKSLKSATDWTSANPNITFKEAK